MCWHVGCSGCYSVLQFETKLSRMPEVICKLQNASIKRWQLYATPVISIMIVSTALILISASL